LIDSSDAALLLFLDLVFFLVIGGPRRDSLGGPGAEELEGPVGIASHHGIRLSAIAQCPEVELVACGHARLAPNKLSRATPTRGRHSRTF